MISCGDLLFVATYKINVIFKFEAIVAYHLELGMETFWNTQACSKNIKKVQT